MIEAQTIAQYEHLSKSITGRHILESSGIRYHAQHGVKLGVPSNVSYRLVTLPLLKNMRREYQRGRLEKRAQDTERMCGKCRGAVFVDAARYAHRRGFVAAVIDTRTFARLAYGMHGARGDSRGMAIALAVAITTA